MAGRRNIHQGSVDTDIHSVTHFCHTAQAQEALERIGCTAFTPQWLVDGAIGNPSDWLMIQLPSTHLSPSPSSQSVWLYVREQSLRTLIAVPAMVRIVLNFPIIVAGQ
ncbi:hypothetical protein MFRU_019g00700 [Monilinia fructicola]|nr:hypothetical protein MFRU_019g00700 [Monilinia fructicola]